MNPDDLMGLGLCVTLIGFMIIFAVTWILQIVYGLMDLRWGFPRKHKFQDILLKILIVWFIIMFSLFCLAFAFR